MCLKQNLSRSLGGNIDGINKTVMKRKYEVKHQTPTTNSNRTVI